MGNLDRLLPSRALLPNSVSSRWPGQLMQAVDKAPCARHGAEHFRGIERPHSEMQATRVQGGKESRRPSWERWRLPGPSGTAGRAELWQKGRCELERGCGGNGGVCSGWGEAWGAWDRMVPGGWQDFSGWPRKAVEASDMAGDAGLCFGKSSGQGHGAGTGVSMGSTVP